MLACQADLPAHPPSSHMETVGPPRTKEFHENQLSVSAALLKEQGQGLPASSHQALGCRAFTEHELKHPVA